MYFSKNSRYVLQRSNWLSPSTFLSNSWRKSNRNLGVKYPQEDHGKPSLRVNIPKDTQQGETTRFIHDSASPDVEALNADPKSKGLLAKKSVLSLNLEKNLLRKTESDTEFWDAEDEILSGSSFGKEDKKKTTPSDESSAPSKSESNKEGNDYTEGLLTPLNEKSLEEALVKNYLNCSSQPNESKTQEKTEVFSKTKNQEKVAEGKELKKVDSKTLYIIIDVPETKEKIMCVRPDDAVQEKKETSPPANAEYDTPAVNSERLTENEPTPKVSKMKANSQKGLVNSAVKEKLKKDPMSWKPEPKLSRSFNEKMKFEINETDDTSTYVFHLKFNKNFAPQTCKVGCVPEKEVDTRSKQNNQNGTPIRARDLGNTKRFKNLSKELITVEDVPEVLKYSDMKKIVPKSETLDKDRFKSWNYGSFKPDAPKVLKIKNEATVEHFPQKHEEGGAFGQEFPHPRDTNPDGPERPEYFSVFPNFYNQKPHHVKEKEFQSTSQVQMSKSESSITPRPASNFQKSDYDNYYNFLSTQYASRAQQLEYESYLSGQDVTEAQHSDYESYLSAQLLPQESNSKVFPSVQYGSKAEKTKPENLPSTQLKAISEPSVSVQPVSQPLQNVSRPEETDENRSVYAQNAPHPKEENVLNPTCHSQSEETQQKGSVYAPKIPLTQEPDILYFKYPNQINQIDEKRSESSQNIPQTQETDIQNSKNSEQIKQIDEKRSISAQSIPQAHDRAIQPSKFSVPIEQIDEKRSVSAQNISKTEPTDNKSSAPSRSSTSPNTSQPQDPNPQYPRIYEQTLQIKSETKLGSPNGSKSPGMETATERSAINISKTYFIVPKSYVYFKDKVTDLEAYTSEEFASTSSTNSLPARPTNLNRKHKAIEDPKDDPKPLERKKTMKKYNSPVWTEKKLRRTGKNTEFQFHSDSKASQSFQGEKVEVDITDFKTSGSVSGENYPRFGAAYPPLLSEALGGLRRVLLVKKDSLFNHKWSSSCDSGGNNFELNPKCLANYSKNSVFPLPKNSNFEPNCLFEGKKNDILNVSKKTVVENCPKVTDNYVAMTNESLTKNAEQSSVNSLAIMKKVKKMVDLDLKNAVKIFEGRDAPEQKKARNSVLTLDGEKWKVDNEELEKHRGIQKKITSNEINLATLGNEAMENKGVNHDDRKTWNDANLTKYLPAMKEKDTTFILKDNERVSAVTYNSEYNEFNVNEKDLETARRKRSNEKEFNVDPFFPEAEVVLTAGTGSKGSSHKLEAKKGDSILIFDDETKLWKVDFSILEKREEQMRQELELRKTSELILEAIEKAEQKQTPNIQKPDSRGKRVFDYKTEKWIDLPPENKIEKTIKSSKSDKPLKSKLSFKESDAEEIRKKNADLYENLFLNKKETKMKQTNEPVSKMDSKKEAHSPILKKEAKESGSALIVSGENKSPPQKEIDKTKNQTEDVSKSDGFWETFLKLDILPKSITGLTKIKTPPNPSPPVTIEEPKPKKQPVKIEDPVNTKIPPFIGDETIQVPQRNPPPPPPMPQVPPPPPMKEQSFTENPELQEPEVISQEEKKMPRNEDALKTKNSEVVENSEPLLPPFVEYRIMDEVNSGPPSVIDAQKQDENETKPSLSKVEAPETDNSELNASLNPVVAQKVDDNESKTSLFSAEEEKKDDKVEAQAVDDNELNTLLPPPVGETSDDTKSKTSIFKRRFRFPGQAPKTDENEKASTPPKMEAQKNDNMEFNATLLPAAAENPELTGGNAAVLKRGFRFPTQAPKTDDKELESMEAKTTEKADVAILVFPMEDQEKDKLELESLPQAIPKSDDSKSAGAAAPKTNSVKSKPSTLSAVQKTDKVKSNTSSSIKAQKAKSLSSTSLKTQKIDKVKTKPAAATKVQKADDLKSKTTQLTAAVQKINDSDLKPPGSIRAKKTDEVMSEPEKSGLWATEEVKTENHEMKPSPSVETQQIDDLKSLSPIESQKTNYPKSKASKPLVGAKKMDDAKSEPTSSIFVGKKDKSAADHYISENILEIARNSAKDKNAKVKPNKIETVKWNITSDKRTPLKITEINLNKKCEEKVKESGSGSKKQNPIEPKKPMAPGTKTDKCPVESNTFYRNFEKYRSSYSDPEYEEKSMKINSDNESNPNLKKLDHWNKTLVLQDLGKQPENIESWLKSETDKMATLLLKVLQEAADGKPKRKQMKGKSVDKVRNKANPYYNIRKKQENPSEHFFIKVQPGDLDLEKKKKEKPSVTNKIEQKAEKFLREIPVHPKNMAESLGAPEPTKRLKSSLEEKPSEQRTRVFIGVKPKDAFEPMTLGPRDLLQPSTPFSDITEDVPGPEFLKVISKSWKIVPVLSTQLTIFTLFSIFQLVKAGTSIFNASDDGNNKKHAFSKLFQKYGPIVNVQGPLSGSIILIHKPEHLSAVFEQDASVPARSVFDSLEQSRKQTEERINSIGLSTDWNKAKWMDLKRALSDPLERGCDKFFEPVDRAAVALINNIRRSRNGQNYASHDFMDEIRSWSMEGLCNVLFEKSFSFLEGRSKNMNWILEPDKVFLAIHNATECLSKCERGFHTWRLMPTPSFAGLGQAYLNLSSILSKQLYQADLNLKNKNEILNNGVINSRDMTFMESMLLNDGMTTDEIICNLIDIMIVGINTMSCTMGFLLYDLSQNTRIQNKLFKEVKSSMPEKDGPLDYHTIQSVKYLQACIKETIRLHAPIPIFYRVLQNDILLSNYIISKGTYIVMDSKSSCMREQNFAKPEEFIPERWLVEDKEVQQCNPFAFFPFCHGPRAQLAKRVVEMQLSTCVARVIRNFRVEYHHGNIAETRNFISCPDKPLKLNFIDREE